VAQSAEPVPLANLTQVLGIDPSSVFRLANTLKRRGFLANPNGPEALRARPRGVAPLTRIRLEPDADQHLSRLDQGVATRTGETAHLAVREGREVFFIDHHASGDQGVIVPGPDRQADAAALHRARQGAASPTSDCRSLKALYGTSPLERYTARTSVSLPDLARAVRARAGRRLFDRRRRVPGRT
jgi:IclR family acetate operon transcriptional repressor